MFLLARKASRARATSTRDQRSRSNQWCSTASLPRWSPTRRARSRQHTAPCLWTAKASPPSTRTQTPKAPRALSRTALQLWAIVARLRAITRRRSALGNTRATLAESKSFSSKEKRNRSCWSSLIWDNTTVAARRPEFPIRWQMESHGEHWPMCMMTMAWHHSAATRMVASELTGRPWVMRTLKLKVILGGWTRTRSFPQATCRATRSHWIQPRSLKD